MAAYRRLVKAVITSMICLICVIIFNNTYTLNEYWIVKEVDIAKLVDFHLRSKIKESFCPDCFRTTVVKLTNQFMINYATNFPTSKANDRYIIGLPTVTRRRDDYFHKTLETLLDNRSKNISYQLIIQIGERNLFEIEKRIITIRTLLRKYGLTSEMEILLPNPQLYNILPDGPLKLENWRRKLFTDLIHLLLYASTKGGFYLHLEDDIDTASDFLHHIDAFRKEVRHENWAMLEFSTLGFLGKMFKVQNIPRLIQLLMSNIDESITGEALIDKFVGSFCTKKKTCAQELNTLRLLHRPSLFQHVGYYSSLPGAEWTNYSDVNFPVGYEPWPWSDVPIYVNPPARISTTLMTYYPDSLQKLYAMTDVLLTKAAKAGDVIYFNFTPPVTIEEFFIRTQHDSYPKRGLDSGTFVEVLSLKTQNQGPNQRLKSDSRFVTVGQVNERGIAEGPLGERFGKLLSLRVLIKSNQKYDVLIKELVLKLQVVSNFQKPCCEAFWPDPFPGTK